MTARPAGRPSALGGTVDAELPETVDALLDDPASGWSVGTWGAVADLERDPGEAAHRADRSVRTRRGGVRVELPPGVVPVAYERCLRPAGAWRQALALCLPRADAAMHGRSVVTALGPDAAAVLPEERGQALFDLGLGAACVDFCVRTRDPELVAALTASEGRSLFDPSTGLAGLVLGRSPTRVLSTRAGRAEVATPIPPPGGTTPWGPHTHLLPKLLASGRTHPAIEPIPAGLVPLVQAFPAHPTVGPRGTEIPFDAGRHERFQALLREYGDPAFVRSKAEVAEAVREDRPPVRPSPGPGSRVRSRAARVALRQLALTDPGAPGLAGWRDAFGERVAE